jgi:thiol-disulfide isomerase/thioredoxin
VKRIQLAALSAVVVLSACSSAPLPTGELPGAVPDDVAFREPPPEAPAAPEFGLELVDGRSLDLTEQWVDRPVVLVFFESWCTLCKEQQPAINDAVENYGDVVLFVGIANLSEPADVEQYVSDNQITYPVGIDPSGRTALNYAAREPPLVVLISKDGRVLRGWPEGVSGEELGEQVDALAIESR